MNLNSTFFLMGLLLCGLPFSGFCLGSTFITFSDGNWQSTSTWAGGIIPDPENIQNHTVIINHDVVLANNNLKLITGALLIINDSEFNISNGNLIVEYGTVEINNSTVVVGGSHNVELNTCNARMEINNSVIEISQNFINNQGFRILINVCLNVHENYANNAGIDTLINTITLIGSNSSGNLQNASGLIFSDNSEFHLPDGNFENESSSVIDGNINAIWLENGDLQNSGIWWAVVLNYCISSSVNIPTLYLPPSEDCNLVPSLFSSSSCCPSDTITNCPVSGPDTICPGNSFIYSTSVSGGNYLWQISGDASIVGSTINQQVQISAATGCNTSFTLTLNISGGNCTFTCSRNIIVNDTILPHCECPPVTSVPCGDPIIFTQPVITDNCGNPAITIYANYVIPQPDGTNFHVQVWQATDFCGNTILSSQGIVELCGPTNTIVSFVEPNPFKSWTNIIFSPVSDAEHLFLEVFNLAGSKVAVLFSGPVKAGEKYDVRFNAKSLPDGIYLYRIFDEKSYTYGKLFLAK